MSGSSIKSYQDLHVWQKAIELVELVYQQTENFPKHQPYSLGQQIERSAVSVPSNIAEGRTRHSVRDFVYHLNIARGSLAELETQIIIAERLRFIDADPTKAIFARTSEVGKMLNGLKNSLKPET